jgi:endonuclease/exonuclease/phosphatase family metal-dependent hydrolase
MSKSFMRPHPAPLLVSRPAPSLPFWLFATSLLACAVDESPASEVRAASAPLEVRGLTAFKAMTYNTQFRPPIVDVLPGGTAGSNLDIYGLDDHDRGKLIAQQIIASGSDVVALQEVFLEDAYDALVETAVSSYPHHTDFDDIFDLNLYGSGMVLFSKLPMRSLGTIDDLQERRRCLRRVGDECFAELLEYQAQAQFEEKATRKGMGYARLQNSHTGRDLHVFFTHFESSVAEAETRGLQIAEALPFMQERLAGAGADDVLLLGDLNIIAPRVDLTEQDTHDYDAHISQDLGSIGLVDTWLAQSPDDNGFSFDAPNNTAATSTSRQRIDYQLLRNPEDGKQLRTCAQHAVVERELFRANLVNDGQQILRDLSDHFAVSLSIGQEASQCDPQRARSMNALSAATPQQTLSQQIAHPGNVQWYRFDNPGSYTFRAFRSDLLTSKMRVRAYAATDLSTPLAPIEGSELVAARGGRVVFASAQPFYVRVDSPDPAWQGAYTFTARQHQGASFDDAIVLDAGQPYVAAQMTSSVTQQLAAVHFRLQQRALASGERQHLTVSLVTDDALRMTLFDSHRQPLPGLLTAPGQPVLDVSAAGSPISGAAQDLFLVVDRISCPTCQEAPFTASWRSDYRELALGELVVRHQTEGLGQLEYDEVSVFMSVDGGPEEQVFVGELDLNASTYLDVPAAIGFRESVKLRVVEADVLTPDDTFAPVTFSTQPTAAIALFEILADSGPGRYTLAWQVSE